MRKTANIYNKIAQDYAKTFIKPTRYINNFLELLPTGGGILDIGCGIGVNLNFAKSKGFDVLGIDFSNEMIEIAKNNYPNINFILGDMRKIKFQNSRFDGVIASYSLIHITKKELPKILNIF